MHVRVCNIYVCFIFHLKIIPRTETINLNSFLDEHLTINIFWQVQGTCYKADKKKRGSNERAFVVGRSEVCYPFIWLYRYPTISQRRFKGHWLSHWTFKSLISVLMNALLLIYGRKHGFRRFCDCTLLEWQESKAKPIPIESKAFAWQSNLCSFWCFQGSNAFIRISQIDQETFCKAGN